MATKNIESYSHAVQGDATTTEEQAQEIIRHSSEIDVVQIRAVNFVSLPRIYYFMFRSNTCYYRLGSGIVDRSVSRTLWACMSPRSSRRWTSV